MRNRLPWFVLVVALTAFLGCAAHPSTSGSQRASAAAARSPSDSADGAVPPTTAVSTPVPIVAYDSLAEAARAVVRAKGQHVVLHADLSQMLDEGLRLTTCDDQETVRVRVPDAQRAALRGIIMNGVRCAEWRVALDGEVVLGSWTDVATGAVVDIKGAAPIAEAPNASVFSLAEIGIRRPPPGARVRASVLDLTIPADKASVAARLVNPPWKNAIKVKLVSRNGVCDDLGGCWAAELVDSPP